MKPNDISEGMRYPDFTLTVKTESASLRDPDDCDWLVKLAFGVNGPYLAGREIPFSDRKPRRYTFCVPWDWAFGLIDELRKLRVSAVPYFEMGCDGGFTELWSGGYGGKVHYRWWGSAPEGWERLDDLAWRLLETFRLLVLDSHPRQDRRVARLLKECLVAGMSHVDGIHKLIEKIEPGSEVSLEREPENSHDPNAVAVLNEDGERIGYLPRGHNEDVARLIDQGLGFRVGVMDVGALNHRCPSMTIVLILREPVPADSGLIEIVD